MKIEIINPLGNSRWLNFISNNSSANIFHYPGWLKVLKEQYGFRLFVVAIVDDADKVLAGVPFCEVKSITGKVDWVSLPFSDYCQPLYKQKEEISVIEGYLIRKQKEGKVGTIEIRGKLDDSSSFVKEEKFFIHTACLYNDIDRIFSTFKKTQIQQPIKKAERDGVHYLVSTSWEQLEEFYTLHLKTRKKLGVPIQPKNFFIKIHNELIKNDLGFIVVTYKDNIPIGSGVFLGFGETLTYKYSASDPQRLKLRPNHLMLWTAFQEGIKKGFKYFDFGRTEKENEGLRKFKLGWGPEEKPLNYYYYPTLPESGKIKFIKDRLVTPIIRNSPELVCRIIGEIAYKYFPSA